LLARLSTPVSVGGLVLTLSASLGISIYPEDGEDVVTLINRADAAMYQHKRGACGGFQFHTDAPAHKPGSETQNAGGTGH
jgi:GGDEF domain-containing protein